MKINFKRIDHLQICIPPGEEDNARNFYKQILGMKEIPKPEYLRIRGGGFWLEVAGMELHIGIEDPLAKSVKRHPAFEIEGLEEVRAYLVGKGVRIRDDKPIPNFRRFSFFDPYDNRIELLERMP